jgi:pyruvate formate lyase activating enzyme
MLTELGVVIKHIRELVPMINSVMSAGGEPLLQPRACSALLRRVRKLGLGRGIKTNGTNPKYLKKILHLLDFIVVDIGAPFTDPGLYGRVVGRPVTQDLLQKIKESLRIAIGSGAEVEARTTVVPALNDRKEIIEEIALDVSGVDRFRLQQFRGAGVLDPSFRGLPSPSRRELIKLARVARKKGLGEVSIFTIDRGLENI